MSVGYPSENAGLDCAIIGKSFRNQPSSSPFVGLHLEKVRWESIREQCRTLLCAKLNLPMHFSGLRCEMVLRSAFGKTTVRIAGKVVQWRNPEMPGKMSKRNRSSPFRKKGKRNERKARNSKHPCLPVSLPASRGASAPHAG